MGGSAGPGLCVKKPGPPRSEDPGALLHMGDAYCCSGFAGPGIPISSL
jgi:hypothetical protein